MPKNKNHSIRVLALDRCLGDKHHVYYMDTLVKKVNEVLCGMGISPVHKRTIQNDLEFMETSDFWPELVIERIPDGHKKQLKYQNPDFSILNAPITKTQLQELKLALKTISRFEGMPQFEWVEEMQHRLKVSLLQKQEEKIVGFEENPELKGLRNYFKRLFEACNEKQVLKVKYKPFKMQEIDVEIHPYYLKQYNTRWFLWGYNPDSNYNPDTAPHIINLAIDRIESIEHLGHLTFNNNYRIDFEDFFFDVVGSSVDENLPVEEVLLCVDNRLYDYIRNKPLHHTQKVVECGEDCTTIKLNVRYNYELETELFGYMDKMRVIQPASLRAKLKSRALRALKMND